MIEVTQLGKSFGQLAAVRGIDFSVRPGEVLGFLGPNGAGKSTTMKMIAGYLAPTTGSVRVCGCDVQEDTLAARRLIGYLPEGAPAYDDMTVIEFFGTGDAFFDGSTDDRPLGKEGHILSRPYNRDAIAIFPSIDVAHEAAKAITNRRPNSLLGVAPRWRDTEAR